MAIDQGTLIVFDWFYSNDSQQSPCLNDTWDTCSVDDLYGDIFAFTNVYRYCAIYLFHKTLRPIDVLNVIFAKNSYYQEFTRETILSSLYVYDVMYVYHRLMKGKFSELYINNPLSLIAVKHDEGDNIHNFLYFFLMQALLHSCSFAKVICLHFLISARSDRVSHFLPCNNRKTYICYCDHKNKVENKVEIVLLTIPL